MCVTFIHLQQVMAVAPYKITDEDVVDFKENSFVIKRNFFEDEVISLVSEVSRAEIKHREGHPEMWDSIPQEQHDLGDKTLFNAICYSERTVNAFQKLIREGCMEEPRWGRTRPDPLPTGLSFHHRKLIIKDEYNHTPEKALDNDHLDTEKPLGGGFRGGNRFLWHQDFLYWGDPDGKDAYDRPGRPFPDLVTSFIAIDPATRENGCLEVLRGSHRLGRLEFKKNPGVNGIQRGQEFSLHLMRVASRYSLNWILDMPVSFTARCCIKVHRIRPRIPDGLFWFASIRCTMHQLALTIGVRKHRSGMTPACWNTVDGISRPLANDLATQSRAVRFRRCAR